MTHDELMAGYCRISGHYLAYKEPSTRPEAAYQRVCLHCNHIIFYPYELEKELG